MRRSVVQDQLWIVRVPLPCRLDHLALLRRHPRDRGQRQRRRGIRIRAGTARPDRHHGRHLPVQRRRHAQHHLQFLDAGERAVARAVIAPVRHVGGTLAGGLPFEADRVAPVDHAVGQGLRLVRLQPGGLEQALQHLGRGGVEVDLAAFVDRADADRGAVVAECIGPPIRHPALFLLRALQAVDGTHQAGLGRVMRLGLGELVARLQAFGARQRGVAAEQDRQQRARPQHQQQGDPALAGR